MGSLESRIGRLEERIGPTPGRNPAQELEREAIVAELKRLRGALRERAEREAAEGHPQRLVALEDLERVVEERRRRGT